MSTRNNSEQRTRNNLRLTQEGFGQPSEPLSTNWGTNITSYTEEDYYVLHGYDEPLVKPHGGSCDHCGQTSPDVFVDTEGNNVCPSCDRYDSQRLVEFHKEKWYSTHRKRRGAQ